MIGPWCNGNTLDFGSDITSSNLVGLTIHSDVETAQPFGVVCEK